MRLILLASALALAACTTPGASTAPTMMRMGAVGSQAAGELTAAERGQRESVTSPFRRPPPQAPSNWGGNAYGGRY